jgi:Flp pilus assembly protein TadD
MNGAAIVCGTFASASSVRAETTDAVVTVEVSEPSYDGFQKLLDSEAHEALAKGDYGRAMWLFSRLLHIDPYDVRALRETGRLASALGQYDLAIGVLARVDELDGTRPDPEIHYLRGEALTALGRKDDAVAEYARTEQELGAGPHDRQGTLWLARIAVLRGDTAGAVARYEALLKNDDPNRATYAEVLLYEVDAYIQIKDWATAERLLRDFLRFQPDHERGRAVLAWVLEGRGKVDEELALRTQLAKDRAEDPNDILAHARALERAGESSAALARYREARALGVTEAQDGIHRLEPRFAPKLGGGLTMQNDPTGTIAAWAAGATLPLGGHLRLSLSTMAEQTSGGMGVPEKAMSSATGWAIATGRSGRLLAVGTTMRLDDAASGRVGGSAIAQSSPVRDFQVQVRGDLGVPWHESATTMRDDGVMDTLGAQVFFKSQISSRRILASVGTQARQLALEPRVGLPMTPALQLFGSAGVDIMLSATGDRAVRGESFDREMVVPRGLTPATVVSYRHYEASSDNPFGARLVLVERSSIDELSGLVRHVFDRGGRLGGELRGGLGYDWARYVQQWRAGASLLLSASAWSRLTVDYDVASESGTGLTGRRHLGSVVLHVDL